MYDTINMLANEKMYHRLKSISPTSRKLIVRHAINIGSCLLDGSYYVGKRSRKTIRLNPFRIFTIWKKVYLNINFRDCYVLK